MAVSSTWGTTDAQLENEDLGEAVLDVLGDDVSREILRAGKTQPVTAEALADRCDVSESTIYRRLDRLNELGLVERCNPLLCEGGKGSYQTAMDGLAVSVDEQGLHVEEGACDDVFEAMETVAENVDLQTVNYDVEDRSVQVSFSLDDELFSQFVRFFADK